jgi:flagellar hook-length control protein FliK
VTLASLASANAPMPALFALAMAPERKPADDNAQPGDLSAMGALLTPADAVALVAKPGQAERQALDMGRQDWPQKMIDRIEALRDDANANDTSIRLKPDALGRIDVSLRTHADGAITVRFSAEQPTTRALLADAAPQLNAAAEARGIRLTGTSVDLSGSGMTGGDRPRPDVERRQDSSNRLATGDDEILAVDDGRVA